MADINSRLEIGVTTGPIRGSKKIYVGKHRVAMREIALEPSSGEPPVRVYDTSGAYTDPPSTSPPACPNCARPGSVSAAM